MRRHFGESTTGQTGTCIHLFFSVIVGPLLLYFLALRFLTLTHQLGKRAPPSSSQQCGTSNLFVVNVPRNKRNGPYSRPSFFLLRREKSAPSAEMMLLHVVTAACGRCFEARSSWTSLLLPLRRCFKGSYSKQLLLNTFLFRNRRGS